MKAVRMLLGALLISITTFSLAAPNHSGRNARDQQPHPPRENITSTTMRGKQNFEPIGNPITLLEQISGLTFDWPSNYGPRRDIGCFPSGDIGTSLPEILEWDVPGEVASGVRLDRVAPLLVEATKQMYVQLEDLHLQVAALASDVSRLLSTTAEHAQRLSAHDSALAAHRAALVALQTKLVEQEKSIKELQTQQKALEEKNTQQDQQIQQLVQAVAALQGA